MRPYLFNRRQLLIKIGSATLIPGLMPRSLRKLDFSVRSGENRFTPSPFTISLSQRSLLHTISTGKITHLDFPRFAKEQFGINAIDYATSFFQEHIEDQEYLGEMKKRAAEQGVRHVLLLIEEENLLSKEPEIQQESLRRHRMWIDAAATLGCRGVRIQLQCRDSSQAQFEKTVNSIKSLMEYAAKKKILGLIGNEFGISRDSKWLTRLVKEIESSGLGAFAYFLGSGSGSGQDKQSESPYQIMKNLMPLTKGVCATAREFDEKGQETHVDFQRMMKIVLDSGYRGYVSLEFQTAHPAPMVGDDQSEATEIKTAISQDEDNDKGQQKETESPACQELAGVKSALALLKRYQSVPQDPDPNNQTPRNEERII